MGKKKGFVLHLSTPTRLVYCLDLKLITSSGLCFSLIRLNYYSYYSSFSIENSKKTKPPFGFFAWEI